MLCYNQVSTVNISDNGWDSDGWLSGVTKDLTQDYQCALPKDKSIEVTADKGEQLL